MQLIIVLFPLCVVVVDVFLRDVTVGSLLVLMVRSLVERSVHGPVGFLASCGGVGRARGLALVL
jgi:hypothetical protein